jgi:hypothetical protein
MEMTLHRAAALLCLLALQGAAGAAGRAPPTLSHVTVTEHGAEADGDFCADFRLTPAQARWFFRRARVYTAPEMHDQFNELPCWVRGTARSGNTTWQWEVRAGGTATLQGADGSALLLGCLRCDRVLGGGPAPAR